MNTANAPHKRPPNTLKENHILPWTPKNSSRALGIGDCCNEIGRNRWCTLWTSGHIDDRNPLLCVLGVDTCCWYNGPSKIARNILAPHSLSVGTPASACHLTPEHWETGREGGGTAMGQSATVAATLIGVGTPTGILDTNTMMYNRTP